MAYNKTITDFAVKPEGYYANVRPEMLEYIPRTSKVVLEFGCGEGIFSQQVKERNKAEVWGVEIDQTTGKTAAKNLDKVIIGDALVAVAQLPDDYFDCIIFNDVLEHLVDPYSVLTQLKAKLKSKGIIVASIPNMRYYPVLVGLFFGGQWEYEDAGVLDKTHLRFFTQSSIKTMFEASGYSISQLEGINPLTKLSWRYWLMMGLTRGRFDDTRFLEFACVATR